MATTTMYPTGTIFSTIPTATTEPMQGVPATAVPPGDDADEDDTVPSFPDGAAEQLPDDATTVLPAASANP